MSIESQTKEMLQLAEREGFTVKEIRRESHSAKATGERPVYNEILADIRKGRFNAILTWAPDRLSRNAGDLGALVDLMDQKLLLEIRTHGQKFTDSPNEKFLLMILGSQAKLENDNRGINVKRGMKTRVEMGLWPNLAPLGYLNQNRMDKKGQIIVDPQRGPVIKQMFERLANQQQSVRKIYDWLRHDLNFHTRGNKALSQSGVHRILGNPFYYGAFEYPKGSGRWCQGKHEPLVTKSLFEKAQEQLTRNEIVRTSKEFAFTKLMTCGLCGSGISGEEKYKRLLDGTTARYLYYGCARGKDAHCGNTYIREEELVAQLLLIIDQVELQELGTKGQLDEELKRFTRFQQAVLGDAHPVTPESNGINLRAFAKYLLKEGSMTEKRELLANLKTRLIYEHKKLRLAPKS